MSAGARHRGAEGVRKAYRASGFVAGRARIELRPGDTSRCSGRRRGQVDAAAVLGLLERPDAGRVLLDGREVTSGDRAARLQMAARLPAAVPVQGHRRGQRRATVSSCAASHERARRARRDALERVGLAGFEERSALTALGRRGAAGRARARARARAARAAARRAARVAGSAHQGRLAREFAESCATRASTVVYVTHDQDEAMVVADASRS